jgi:D-beta-D-heptose 7-phosphate kinase/D-beta-D-heptose 1-phosphate adenosyltransferase
MAEPATQDQRTQSSEAETWEILRSFAGFEDWHSFSWWEKAVFGADLLASWSRLQRDRGYVIAMTCGNFDPPHAGHVDGFSQGIDLIGACERVRPDHVKLLVGIDGDADVKRQKIDGRPYMPLVQRMMVLAAFGCVSAVVPFRGGLSDPLIEIVRPHGFFKGSDRTWWTTPERVVLLRTGTKFHRVVRRLPLTSTEFIASIRRKPKDTRP